MFRTEGYFARRRKAALMLLFAATAVSAPAWGDDDLADPMRPPAALDPEASVNSEPKYVLHGTILGPKRRIALVNGVVVALGERIGDAELVGIDVGRVILVEGEAELELSTNTNNQRQESPVIAEQRVAHEDS